MSVALQAGQRVRRLSRRNSTVHLVPGNQRFADTPAAIAVILITLAALTLSDISPAFAQTSSLIDVGRATVVVRDVRGQFGA